jgi:hypothetical protein
MVKAQMTTPIAEIIKADKLQKAAASGLRGVTSRNPAPGVPVTPVRVVGLVSDQGVIPVTAEGRAVGQARDPGKTGSQASDPGQAESQTKDPGKTGVKSMSG